MKTVKEWCWMHYEQYLVNEWIQCRNEGRDVDDLKELCEFVERESRREGSRRDFEAIGAETGRLLVNSAVKPGYAYNEPSDYESILDARPEQTFSPVHPKQSDALRDRIAGAWAGRIAGCLIGKPFEGWRYANIKKFLSLSGNMPMRRYARLADFTETVRQHFEPNPEAAWADNFTGASPADDDTTYTVIGLKTVESFGRDFLAVQALESWLRYMPIVTACTAERITYCLSRPKRQDITTRTGNTSAHRYARISTATATRAIRSMQPLWHTAMRAFRTPATGYTAKCGSPR